MKVKIRLQNHGVKNHRFWWIVVQPHNRNVRGRYLEKVGYWLPRKTVTVQRSMIVNRHSIQYWLGVGATCTNRVHRILEKFGMVPKLPTPYGSSSVYEKPEKEYGMDYYRKKTHTKQSKDIYYKQQLQEQMNILERKKRIQQEALENLGSTGAAVPKLEEIKTSDIESEEVDIFERKTKFEELLKRMDKHRKEAAHLRGNDLRYNIYMKKLNKLTRMDLGLDLEAYKDYVNNLKQFAAVNEDFQLFARDYLSATDDPKYRQMIEFNFNSGQELKGKDLENFKVRCEDIYNVIRKLRREACGFLTNRDHELMQEFILNMRHYLRSYELLDYVLNFYQKRQREDKLRQLYPEFLDTKKVTDRHLEEAEVSKREFSQMKILLKLDEAFFRPSEHGAFSPHSMIVDISKYENLGKEAKDLLYRPPKVKSLYEKYWQLAKVVQDIEKEENDQEILKGFFPKYPKKPVEEYKLIDQIMNRITELINQDENEVPQEQAAALLGGEAAETQMHEELKEGGIEFYEGAGQEALNKWNKLSPEQKEEQKKGDDIDDINTTDLEVEDRDMEGLDFDFLERNKINLARAFLGYDGGYTIRKLKKIYKQDKLAQQEHREGMKRRYDERIAREAGGEGGADPALAQEAQTEETKGEGDKANPKATNNSDESDDERLNAIDDETFQKIIDKAKLQNFSTEEEAKAFFDDYVKEEWNKHKKRGKHDKVDEREKTDPYHAMLKRDKDIQSIGQNEFIVTPTEQRAIHKKLEQNIGRYPQGFRHFENYEAYKLAKPDAQLQDYHNEMNRQCEFNEFRDIMKAGFLQHADSPMFRFKHRLGDKYESNTEQSLDPELFVNSAVFEDEMRAEYQKKVKNYLMDKSWYKLVDALEEMMDFWYYGRDYFTVPNFNLYIPTKHTIMNRPDMMDDTGDDMSYRYNLNRLSPYHYLNTLKGYPMLPAAGKKETPNPFKPVNHIKWRRISQTKMHKGPDRRGFSTLTNQNSHGPQATFNFMPQQFGYTQHPSFFTPYITGFRE